MWQAGTVVPNGQTQCPKMPGDRQVNVGVGVGTHRQCHDQVPAQGCALSALSAARTHGYGQARPRGSGPERDEPVTPPMVSRACERTERESEAVGWRPLAVYGLCLGPRICGCCHAMCRPPLAPERKPADVRSS